MKMQRKTAIQLIKVALMLLLFHMFLNSLTSEPPKRTGGDFGGAGAGGSW
jgi:hypothetical protein